MTGISNATLHTANLPHRVTSLVSEHARANTTMRTVHIAFWVKASSVPANADTG